MSGAFGFPTGPFLDPATGDMAAVWRRYLVEVFRRTASTPSDAQTAPIVLTPSSSPFIYTPALDGVLFASGGGIEVMTLQRGTAPAYAVGGFYGATPLRAGDVLTIRYIAPAPKLVFFPG